MFAIYKENMPHNVTPRSRHFLRNNIVVGLFLMCHLMYGQVIVSGIVRDSASGAPLPFCSYILKGTTSGGVANDSASFVIRASRVPFTVVFNMPGYKTNEVYVRSADQQLVVRMAPSPYTMKTVTITTDRVLTWHPDDAWSFTDFRFYDNYILALVSMRGKNKDYLVLMDTLGTKITTLALKHHGDSLYTDCLGSVHLFCGDSVYQVYYDYSKLSLPYASERNSFVNTMSPCRCSAGPYYYFTFSSYHHLREDFYFINWFQKGTYHQFLTLADSEKIRSYNSKYDLDYFLERRRCCQEYEEPLDSIIANMDKYRAAMPLSLLEQQLFKPIHAPMEISGDQLFIVDPVDTTLLTFSNGGEQMDSIFLSCMRMEGWRQEELYLDVLTGALYGRVVGKNGYSSFVQISSLTGKETGRVTVDKYQFITHPVVRGNTIYFLWKDPYSDQPTKLREMSL